MKNELELQLIEEANYKVEVKKLQKCAAHCYSHLMKCSQVSPMTNSWVSTIKRQHELLCGISNSHWSQALQDPNLIESIRKDAIEEYSKEGNPNGEIAFTVVKNTFNSLNELKDISKLRMFLLAKAMNNNDDEMVDNIRKLFK